MASTGKAIGFIETKGFIGAVEAADTMLKAASVSLQGYKKTGSGYIAVMVRGDVAAVKAAVEAGTEAAARVGEVITTQVIASPHEDLEQMI
ncbi:BMC domain-containing protein [bacterium]|nr:BMC domain-containing protein [bacterium]